MADVIRWGLESGPDRSHLFEYCEFGRLKDAKAAACDLPSTPNGQPRPYRVWRRVYAKRPGGWEEVAGDRVVIDAVGCEI